MLSAFTWRPRHRSWSVQTVHAQEAPASIKRTVGRNENKKAEGKGDVWTNMESVVVPVPCVALEIFALLLFPQGSSAMAFVCFPVAFVLFTVGTGEHTKAVLGVCPPLSCVLVAAPILGVFGSLKTELFGTIELFVVLHPVYGVMRSILVGFGVERLPQ